jgi:GntR family transcriptional repressor for pyruvate dehydrogenase complex
LVKIGLMKSFTKIRSKRLPELVADQIEAAIVSGDFEIDSQLPSEQHLASQFEVSRNVVREAFKYLQERGLIAIVNGSGAYVSRPSAAPTSSALGRYIRLLGAHESLGALYEARRIFEGENARLAALRAQPEDIERLEDCLNRMSVGAAHVETWTQADLDFHLAIAKATHNPFLSVLLEPLVDQLRGVMAEGYRKSGAVERGFAAHVRLTQAIKAHDAEAAYQAIIDHLRDSEARLENSSSIVAPR